MDATEHDKEERGMKRISVRGIGARRCLASVLLASCLLLAILMQDARAAETVGPPSLQEGVHITNVHSTRVFFGGEVELHGSAVTYHVEYRPGTGGPWELAEQGAITEPGNGIGVLVHHLQPNTMYSVRIRVENASGEAEATGTFTTEPVGAPELAEQFHLNGGEECSALFGAEGPPICLKPLVHAAILESEIESNGAETGYQFEYATSPGGPFAPIAGGGGTVTVAEDFAKKQLELGGLAPETEYFVRVSVDNEIGTGQAGRSFQTLTARPRAGGGHLSGVGPTAAEFLVAVAPDGSDTEWRVESSSAEGGPWAPVAGAEGLITATEGEVGFEEISAELNGLRPATAYYVRIVAENGFGTAVGEPQSFETAGPPEIRTLLTRGFQSGVPRLLGSVNPHGFDTHYHFEYVTRQHFEAEGFADPSVTPEGVVAVGEEEDTGSYRARIVGADLPGAGPGQTYLYRLLAGSGAPGGTLVEGEDRAITAPQPPPPPSSCPNEALRTGASARLPDCRAYELVTPAQKGTQDLFALAGIIDHFAPSLDGERALLQSVAQLGTDPGAENSPYAGTPETSYLLSRSATGWRLQTVYPPDPGHEGYVGEVFSPELDQVGVQTSDFTTLVEHVGGIGLGFGPFGGPYRSVVSEVPVDEFLVQGGNFYAGTSLVGADPSFEHLIVSSVDHHLAGGAAAGSPEHAPNLYEFADGRLSLLNVDSSGSLLGDCGAELGSGAEVAGNFAQNAVSSDGAEVFFTVPAAHHHVGVSGPDCEEPTRLYMRRGEETVEVSAPEPGVVDPTGPHPVFYQGAAADGSKVFFTTAGELTADDLGIHTEQLYEWEAATGRLIRVSRGESGTSGVEVIAGPGHQIVVSEDGSTVYFKAQGSLTREAPNVAGGAAELYAYDTSTGETSYVASDAHGLQDGGKSLDEVTPDGRFLLFDSSSLLGMSPQSSRQMYLYDAADQSLTCVSCEAGVEGGVVEMPSNDGHGSAVYTLDDVPRFRAISDAGSYVFFTTTAALVPRDVNEAEDAYEWHEGSVSLLGDGRNPRGSTFLGADADGRDAFISSHEQLSPWDKDQQGDAYDARIDGGFPPPPPAEAPCEGDACHNPPVAPAEPTLSSSVPSGPGNASPPGHVRHKKHRRHRHRKHPRHKQKRPAGRVHRQAGADHGGGK